MKKKSKFLLLFLLLFIPVLFFCGCSGSVPKNVYISEVMSSNTSVFKDENGNFSDWIEICNPSGEDINLEGFSLTDDGMKSGKFVFPSFVLKSGGYLVIFADGTFKADAETGVFHVPFKISKKSGEGIRLYEKDGSLISFLSVPILEENSSFGIDKDGKQKIFSAPTPGKANDSSSESKKGVSASEKNEGTKSIVINEYSTTKTQTLTDGDGDFVSWVELFNGGKTDADLSGFFLSDDEREKEKWSFPEGTTIKKNGYLIVFLSGKDEKSAPKGELHASFKLSGKENGLFLFDKDKKEIASTEVFELFSNLSCGKTADGKTAFFSKATPGKKNSSVFFESVDSAAKTKNKELVITEVAAVNTSVKAPDGKIYDYIELLNNSEKSINLKNYKLSDSKKAESFKSLPEKTVAPGEYCVIYCADKTVATEKSVYFDIGLNRYGETVFLSDRDKVIADSFEYSRLSEGFTAGRNVDSDDSTVYFSAYTPGKRNPKKSLSKALSNPVFSKSSTYVKSGEKISVTASRGEIRYTLDGSVPTEKSKLLSGEITIKRTTVLRARAFKEGFVPSDTVTATYIVGRKSKLDTVFLVTDNDNLYDSKTGIWANGPGYTEEFPHTGANYWKNWERPVNFEYMTANGESQVSFDAGISVFGQFSRALEQKSVEIKLRDKYGPGEICYPFFENNDVNVFSSLVLRNGGQDFEIAHIRDAFCSQVIKGSVDVDFMDYKPVVCYVNGKYHGIYDLREKIDEDYLENHHGIDGDNVDIIKGNNIINSGSDAEYKKLLNYIKTHDVTNDSVYNYICSQIDIDELISYWMCESFFSNTDTGNIRFWREKKDTAKWRWIFFDADWALFPTTYEQSSVSNYLNPYGHGVSNAFDTTIMKNLIKNSKFRKRLIEIHAEHLNTTFSTKRLLKIFDAMINEIDDEMKYHTERWKSLGYNGWKSNVSVLRKIIEKKRSLFINDLIKTLNLTDEEIKLLKSK